MQMQSSTDVPVLSHIGANALLASSEYQDEYAAGLMEDAQDGLPQLSFQMRETAFYKQQDRATPRSSARKRTVEDLMFVAAVAEYEELKTDLGVEAAEYDDAESDDADTAVEAAEYMASTFLECIEDPCGARDNFLSKVERALGSFGYSEEKTRAEYAKAAKRVAEAHIEWAVPFQPKSEKPKDERPAIYRKIDKAVSDMPREVSDLDLNTTCNNLVKHSQFDSNAKEYLIEQISTNTHRGKRAARKAVQESVAAMRQKNKPKPGKDSVPVVNEWGEPQMAKWGEEQMAAKTVHGIPAVFQFEGDVCQERNGKREMKSERQFAAMVNDNTKWERVDSVGDFAKARQVFAPDKVVGHMFHHHPKPYAELASVHTAPYFAPDGRLVFEDCYDAKTQTLLKLNGLDVGNLSAEPCKEDLREAMRLIFEEAFGDFPIGGMARADIVNSLVEGKGEVNPDAAHLLAMLLQPFVRDMISGVTPMYAVTKPLPGTGGGLLLETASLITDGEPAAMLAMPPNEEELTKTVSTLVNEGARWCPFDNLNAAVMLGNLASALTTPTYRARLLHSNRTVNAPIRWVWAAVANNIKGSSENLRRMVMIELDAHTAAPEKRDGWRHADLPGWVMKNRGKLVWACLTLIQNWVAKGMNPWEGKALNSFEGWSRVMGGILRDAGVRGFLDNRDRLRSYAATAQDSGVQSLVDVLAANYPDGQLFRAGGTGAIRGRNGQSVESIKDVLEECGEDGGALAIDGWGWSSGDDGKIRYGRSTGIARNFRDAARVPWECGEWDILFEEQPDPQSSKQFYWIMRKTKHPNDDEENGEIEGDSE